MGQGVGEGWRELHYFHTYIVQRPDHVKVMPEFLIVDTHHTFRVAKCSDTATH